VLLIWQKNEQPIVSRRSYSPLKSKIASLKIHNASKGEPSEAHAGVCMRAGVDLHLAPALCILRGARPGVWPFSLAPAFLSRTGASLSLSLPLSLVLFHHDIKKRVSLVPAVLCGSIVVLFPCIL
jgi:hypothetical protein